MKTYHLINVLIIAPFLLWVYSCNYPEKSKIELKFEEYIRKNSANPSNLVEIASIELEDSVDMRELYELCLSEPADSIIFKISKQMNVMSYFAKRVPDWFKRDNGEYAMYLVSSYSDVPLVTLQSKWENLKKEYEKVDSLNLTQKCISSMLE